MKLKKYYVYSLSSDGSVFYIGKGCGYRMYTHVNSVKNGKIPHGNRFLFDKITELLSENAKIEYKKHFHSDCEKDAYSEEFKLIKSIGVDNLCNIIDSEGPLSDNERLSRVMKKRHKHGTVNISGLKKFNTWRKGKSVEEAYGEERGRLFRENAGKHLKGKTYEEIYGDDAEKYRHLRSLGFLGGKHTEETKLYISKKLKGKPPTPGFSGRSHSIESKLKTSKKVSGKLNPNHIVYTIKSPIGKIYKLDGKLEVLELIENYTTKKLHYSILSGKPKGGFYLLKKEFPNSSRDDVDFSY